jgi:hypothetical protein
MSIRFDMPPGAALRIITGSGDVTLTAEDRQDLEIDAGGRSVQPRTKDRGRTVVVRAARLLSVDLHIRCPLDTDVSVGSISADVRLAGSLGSVKVTTVSGQVQVDAAADVDVRSVSGDLSVANCRGRCRLNTRSGRITARTAAGPTHASTISGDVQLQTSGQGDMAVRTVSGEVTIEVPHGKQPRARLRSLTGRVHCDCPQGTDFDLQCTTVSGRVEVKTP